MENTIIKEAHTKLQENLKNGYITKITERMKMIQKKVEEIHKLEDEVKQFEKDFSDGKLIVEEDVISSNSFCYSKPILSGSYQVLNN